MRKEQTFNVCTHIKHGSGFTLANHVVKGKRIVLTPLTDLNQATLEHCHIFFVNGLDQTDWNRIKPYLTNANVLTVSDDKELDREGVTIMLYGDGNRMVFDIDRQAAQQAQLTFSSQLLRLARAVR